jgi:hypothetical protein
VPGWWAGVSVSAMACYLIYLIQTAVTQSTLINLINENFSGASKQKPGQAPAPAAPRPNHNLTINPKVNHINIGWKLMTEIRK